MIPWKNRPKIEPKQEPVEMDPELLRQEAEDAKDYLNNALALADWAFWLDDPDVQGENPYWDWFSAMEALDRRGDKEPLREMLREFFAKTDPTVGLLIDDMFARYNFARVSNRPRTPIYDLSNRERSLLIALESVRDKRRNNISKEKAIEEAARDWNINPDTLKNAVEGRRTSLSDKLKEFARLKSRR